MNLYLTHSCVCIAVRFVYLYELDDHDRVGRPGYERYINIVDLLAPKQRRLHNRLLAQVRVSTSEAAF